MQQVVLLPCIQFFKSDSYFKALIAHSPTKLPEHPQREQLAIPEQLASKRRYRLSKN